MNFLQQLVSDAQQKKQQLQNVIGRDVVNPVTHAAGNVVNAVSAHNTIRPVVNVVNRDVVQPVSHAGGNVVNTFSAHNTINPLINGTYGVRNIASELPTATVKTFAPLARSAVGTAQAGSGLYDMLQQHTLHPQQTRFDKALNWEAQRLDQAPRINAGPAGNIYYHGGQALGDLAQFAIGTGEAKAGAEAAANLPKVGKLITTGGKVIDKGEQLANDATKGLRAGNVGQRIAGNAAKNILNPKYQAVNAGYTALQAGKTASQGKAVTPGSIATNLAVGGLAFPAAGAVAHEVVAPLAHLAANTNVSDAALAGANLAKNTTKAVGQTTHDVISQKPFRNISDQELASAQKVRDAQSGWGNQQDITPQDMANYASAMRKAGATDANNVEAIDNVIGARHTYQTRQDYLKANSQAGKALVSEDGSVIPTFKKLAGKGSQNYKITVRDGQGGSKSLSVSGTPVAPYKGIKTFVHRPTAEDGGKGWHVSEQSTGLKVGEGKTQAEAIANAQANIEKAGVDKTKQLIASAKDNPAYKPQRIDTPKAPANPPTQGSKTPAVKPPTLKQKVAALPQGKKTPVAKMTPVIKKAENDYATGKISAGKLESIRNQEAKASQKPATPEQIGKALGMSSKDIKAARATSATESAPLADRLQPKAESRTKTPAKTTLKSSDGVDRQQSKTSPDAGGGQKAAGSRPSDIKYTSNARKVKIATVNPGDYQKVRSNAQLVQSVVHNHAQSVIHALNKLTKTERGNFWHQVEDPSIPRSAAMKEAISRWQAMADTVHSTSQALGGDTPYRTGYARHNWDLSDPEQAALYEQLMKDKLKDSNYSPEQFQGLDNKPRVFDTIKEGQSKGFKLKNDDPRQDIIDYAAKSKQQLKVQAVAKGMQEAEEHIPNSEKSETQTIGYKKSIETTKQGVKELRSLFPPEKSSNKALVTYRKVNRGTKQFLLSLSQFHPININLQAAPALALKGHPIRAMRGLIDSAAAINRKYSDHIMQSALKDGTLEDGARIGTPVATGSDFAVSGNLDVKAGLGERMIFERQLPAMHVQMIRAVVSDLKKRGVSLDSPEARKAGTTVNEIMGYVNTEMRNLSPTVQRGLGDVALAPQFTRSKWQVLHDALTKGGEAGSYARRAVVGKYAAEAAISLAVGALLGQKSDNVRDVLLRTLVHPSIPTPFKDSRGNTLELGLPHNYISEAGNLIGSLKRGTNGRVGITVDLAQIPGNLRDYGKSRLAIIPSDTLKVATNTDFSNKPLYNPTSPLKDQLAQTATTLTTGHLPIGLQGLVHTGPVEKHLPGNIQQVLNASSPGTNPIVKSAASAFGLNMRTDKTVGKGQQTTQYYEALDKASRGLNRQEKDALDLYTGGKKNPVTGQYDILPNANDARAKAATLLQNPKVVDHLIAMNKSLAAQGQKVDPLWQQSKDHINSYLQYQNMAPSSADKSDWLNKNNSWYQPLSSQRSDFFNSLPPGDPNKPKLNIQYPAPNKSVQSALDGYNALTDSTAKGQYLDQHPEIIKQWNAVADYNNKMRQALGYSPLKNYPEASDSLQKFMNAYSAADKGTRKGIRNSNPQQYQNMIAYYDAVDLYNNNKQGAISQLQGEPDYTSKQAKAISSLGQDIYQNPDGTYGIYPAGWMNGMSNGSGYGTSGGSKLTPSDFKSPYSAANGGMSKGAQLARNAKLVKANQVAIKSMKAPAKKALPTLKKKAFA